MKYGGEGICNVYLFILFHLFMLIDICCCTLIFQVLCLNTLMSILMSINEILNEFSAS